MRVRRNQEHLEEFMDICVSELMSLRFIDGGVLPCKKPSFSQSMPWTGVFPWQKSSQTEEEVRKWIRSNLDLDEPL